MTAGEVVSGTHARQLTPDPMTGAACDQPGVNVNDWFPERVPGRDNHGAAAKAVCAGCPVLEPCLVDALERRAGYGIWGGAGEARRRVLRKVLGTAGWPAALAAHRRDLVGQATAADRLLLGGGGTAEGATADGRTHGRRVTYARGCRCSECCAAAALGTAVTAVLKAPRRRGSGKGVAA